MIILTSFPTATDVHFGHSLTTSTLLIVRTTASATEASGCCGPTFGITGYQLLTS